MSLIQFEGLTMFYTHEKNDMSNQNNIVISMIVFSYVGKIIHPIKSQSDACLCYVQSE